MAAALWMMLDRFVFRREDDESFPDDETAPWAHGTSSQGDIFRVAFRIVEPPSISRLYLQWPGGAKDGSSCDLVAAHGNLLLLRLTSGPVEKDGSLVHPQDYFLCEGRAPSSPDQPPLRLHRIPICDIPLVFYLDDGRTRTAQRPFDLRTVGILCRGEEFAVAQLRVTRPHTHRVEAELCVLRSDVTSSDHSWEVEQQLPIMYHNVGSSQLARWRTNMVVPFEKSLCWVNYSLGGILLCKVLNERPAIKYLALPSRCQPGDLLDPHHRHDHIECSCCCLCTTHSQDGHKLMFINVDRGDRKLVGPMRPGTGFTATGHILRKARRGRMEWDKVFGITSDQLWAFGDFPRGPLILPLPDMVKPDVIYFLLSEEEAKSGIDRVYVLAFDMTKYEASMLPYITDEDLKVTDADFIQRKSYLLDPFVPSELPRFLWYFSSEHKGLPEENQANKSLVTSQSVCPACNTRSRNT